MLSYFFHLWMSLCWVTVRLETMGSMVLFLVALFAVLLAHRSYQKGSLRDLHVLVYVTWFTPAYGGKAPGDGGGTRGRRRRPRSSAVRPASTTSTSAVASSAIA